jgi:regulator of protease activity HflC (stomatin/prohibitin superfamily)
MGRLQSSRGPGVHLVLPIIDQAETVDTRIVTLATPVLEELTLDHVYIKISLVCLFHITDASKAVSKINNVNEAVSELLQTTLRTVVSQHDLKHVVTDRGRMNMILKSKLEKQVREWGVKINAIEIKEVKIPKEMKKLISKAKRLPHHHAAHDIDHEWHKFTLENK